MHHAASPATTTASSAAGWPSPGLVVVGPGGVADPTGLEPLAALLRLRLLPLWSAAADANGALAQLAQEPPGWLQALPIDPAADRGGTGCWAERLGAWRQAVVLLVPAAQVGEGPDRAYSAVLQREAVPLLGLVQLGGTWCPEHRRSDGLGWLGWLPEGVGAAGSAEELAAQALALQLMRRWSISAARAAGPAHPAA